eukprot:scaffold399909_cov36-Prasinocladus_malaysianus.AAC.1
MSQEDEFDRGRGSLTACGLLRCHGKGEFVKPLKGGEPEGPSRALPEDLVRPEAAGRNQHSQKHSAS